MLALSVLSAPIVSHADNKAYVWWHWCGTAVSEAGIVRDLDAMAASGIGGATIFQVARGPCSEVPAYGYEDDTIDGLEFGNDKWWKFVRFAVREAKKRSLKIGMHNCPGYTVSGGPWITPELGMKKLVFTTSKTGTVPPRPESNLGFYREIGQVERNGKIYRFGYTCTGSQCMPVAKSLIGRCLEADKMNARAVNLHLDRILAHDVGLDFILMDSYEAGPYDWTDDFREEFTRRRGYDPLPHLPDYVDRHNDKSSGIAADIAKTVKELSSERHYRVFKKRLSAKNLKFFVEPYGGPFDKNEAAWLSDMPMTEFWSASPFWYAPGDIGAHASAGGAAGRAAGKTIIAAEAYTAMPFQDPYILSPRDFKACTDASFARGINLMFLHHWTHQPLPACRRPGMNMGYWGAHFGQNQTWFEPGKAFFAYLNDCQRLLQQGEEIIDVLAVEDFRGITDGVDIVPERIFKTDVDFTEGRAIVRTSGRSYRYIAVAPEQERDSGICASVAAARKAGVKILNSATDNLPKRPFSVNSAMSSGKNGPILGTARRIKERDEVLFFVANVSSTNISFLADFRASGSPELWYPASDEKEFLPKPPLNGGYSRLKLTLNAQESVFISFRNEPPALELRRKRASIRKRLDQKWIAAFQSGLGGPEGDVVFDSLSSWSDSQDPALKYYSGTCRYRTIFTLSADEAGSALSIDLGEVRDIARVRLNGHDLGVAWFKPFSVPLRNSAREGKNILEVEVTNGWHNRLLGDKLQPDDCEWGPDRHHQCHLDGSVGPCGKGLKRIPAWAWNHDGARPSSGRIAFSSWDYFNGTEKPRESGLLGPVVICFE